MLIVGNSPELAKPPAQVLQVPAVKGSWWKLMVGACPGSITIPWTCSAGAQPFLTAPSWQTSVHDTMEHGTKHSLCQGIIHPIYMSPYFWSQGSRSPSQDPASHRAAELPHWFHFWVSSCYNYELQLLLRNPSALVQCRKRKGSLGQTQK